MGASNRFSTPLENIYLFKLAFIQVNRYTNYLLLSVSVRFIIQISFLTHILSWFPKTLFFLAPKAALEAHGGSGDVAALGPLVGLAAREDFKSASAFLPWTK